MSTMVLEVAGEKLLMHADKALLWPARRTLLVADVHLGKSDLLRRHGIPIPSGSTQTDLQRIATLVREFSVERLVVLGDLVHSRIPDQAPWLEQLAEFRRAHHSLSLQLVGGNHDRHLRAADLNFIDLGERWLEPPFVGLHATVPDPAGFVLGGHIHPVAVLRSRPHALRVPVFWRQRYGLTLPAFGRLTGGYAVQAARGEQLYACAGRIIALANPHDAAELAASSAAE